MAPFSHTNPRQMRSMVSVRNPPASQLQSSCSVSTRPVGEMPRTTPSLFKPCQGTVLLGPPRVPSLVIEPSRQRAACRLASPGRVDHPATQPWLLMLMPRLCVPPRDAEYFTTWYDAFDAT